MEAVMQSKAFNTNDADSAYHRIDALLRAYGIKNAAIRGHYSQRILQEALQQKPSSEHLESYVAQITIAKIRQGVEQLATHMTTVDETVDMDNFYLALQRSKIPQMYPDVILAQETLNQQAMTLVRKHYDIQATPSIRRISMGASPLRFDSIDEVTGSTSRLLKGKPLLQILVKGLFGLLILTIIYQFSK